MYISGGNMKFKLNNDFRPNGWTSLACHVKADYRDLAKLFGAAPESDGYKSSGEWTFESEGGDAATLYDCKLTNLYDNEYVSVNQFRNSGIVTFNIGAKDNYTGLCFKDWLQKKLNSL